MIFEGMDMTKQLILRYGTFLFLTSLLALSSCGGGGGGGGNASAFPAASEDFLPAGTRIDVSAQNLFPMSAGDVWNYNDINSAGTTVGTYVRQITAGPDSAGNTSLTESGGGFTDVTNYVVSADGLLLSAPLEGAAPASAASIVGSLFEYVTPFYPQGETRLHVRSGSWGEDLEGDGISESFLLEYSQVFVGFESIQFDALSLTNVAHFRNVVELTLRPTVSGNTDYTITTTEETWFAPNLGLVKSVPNTVDSDGFTLEPTHTLAFSSATVNGVNWTTAAPPTPTLDGQVLDVPLVHNALVYDSVLNRYYASIPSSVVGNGNSIATIEPVTGQVTYSAPIGSEPNAMAIAAEGSVLYVGLDGSGDVVKLALPTMTELGRTMLVNDTFFGQSLAANIAVSPVDATVVAVSMAWSRVHSSGHAGVALLRDMVMQPNRTQTHTGSNLVTFDATGMTLYGLNTETSEFGLRNIQVLADGLAEQFVVTAATGFGTRALSFANGRVIAGSALYDAPTLTAAGQVSGAQDCWPSQLGDLLVCFNNSSGPVRVLVASSSTFATSASLVYTGPLVNTGPQFDARLVLGPAGQIAISYANPFYVAPSIRLFSSLQLP